jgi:HdeA/HdeB family protein
LTLAACLAFTAPAFGMGFMVSLTGPGNVTCNEFRKLGPTRRAQALAWAQGYAAARNLYADPSNETQISLWENWREFDKRVMRYCSDKTNPYLYRKFINDAAGAALEEMQADKKFRAVAPDHDCPAFGSCAPASRPR